MVGLGPAKEKASNHLELCKDGRETAMVFEGEGVCVSMSMSVLFI